MASKRPQTMAKRAREQAVKEKRDRKRDKKAEAAAQRAAGGGTAGDEDAEGGGTGPDRTLTIVDAWSRSGDVAPPVGAQRILGGKNLGTLVFETGRPARIDSYADASGPLGIAARDEGAGAGVGSPVVVEGRLWGVM